MKPIGDVIYTVTGVMPQRCIERKSLSIGQKISIAVAQSDNHNDIVNRVREILQKTLGKRAKRIHFVTSRQEYIELENKNLGISAETAAMRYDNSLSGVTPRWNGDKVGLSLRLEKLPRDYVGATSAHEIEHALYEAFSFNILKERIIFKIPKLKNIIYRNELKYADLTSQKLEVLQSFLAKIISSVSTLKVPPKNNDEGLLQQCRIESLKKLHTVIKKFLYSSGILTIGEDKKNLFFLKSIICIFKDEETAYKVGGETWRYYNGLTKPELADAATDQDLCSRMYHAAIEVMKKEKKHVKRNLWRKMFRLKPDYSSEQKLQAEAQVESLFYYIVLAGQKLGKTLDFNTMMKNAGEILQHIAPVEKRVMASGRTAYTDDELNQLAEITEKVLTSK